MDEEEAGLNSASSRCQASVGCWVRLPRLTSNRLPALATANTPTTQAAHAIAVTAVTPNRNGEMNVTTPRITGTDAALFASRIPAASHPPGTCRTLSMQRVG